MPSDFFKNLPKDKQDELKNQVKRFLNLQESEKANKEVKEITDWAEANSEVEKHFNNINTQKNGK
jgi:hypothetical protein